MKKGTGQIHKQKKKKKERKTLGFQPAIFRVRGEHSPDWATGDVSAAPENHYTVYIAKQQ